MPALLTMKDLRIDIPVDEGVLRAVSGVDLQVEAGEVLCLVGESGCGKSLTAASVLDLLPRNAVRRAEMLTFEDVDLLRLARPAMEDIRGRRVGMVFQDPQTALNPTLTIGRQLEESYHRHVGRDPAAARASVLSHLADVGITAPADRLRQYPHQLSGGMLQRVLIAMALIPAPKLLIADEPTTALDVTIQAQILALLRRLQRQKGIGLLLITHDFGVVAAIADRVAVMYAGRIVETGPVRELLRHPRHPYTRGLLACVPRGGNRGRPLGTIPGRVPTLLASPAGCAFASRCDLVDEGCTRDDLALQPVSPDIAVRCRKPFVRPPADPQRQAPAHA